MEDKLDTILCGDCITGCNIGAKNTLLYNYLPVAKHNGTEFYTQCEVESIEKHHDHYRLNLVYFDEKKSGELMRTPVSITTQTKHCCEIRMPSMLDHD